MIEQIRLGIDIDGVLANFTLAFAQAVNTMYGDKIHLAEDFEPHTWSWVDSGVVTKEQENRAWEHIKAQEDFWLAMKPYAENVKALEMFLNRVNFAAMPVSIFYITSRVPTAGMSVLKQTRLWLEAFQLHRYYTAIFPVVHSNNSGGLPPKLAIVEALGLNAMIDDYLPTVKSLGRKGWLLDRPWNRADRESWDWEVPLQVVSSLEEFLSKFEPARARTALPI